MVKINGDEYFLCIVYLNSLTVVQKTMVYVGTSVIIWMMNISSMMNHTAKRMMNVIHHPYMTFPGNNHITC